MNRGYGEMIWGVFARPLGNVRGDITLLSWFAGC